MAELLSGKPVAEALDTKTALLAAELREKGLEPTLAVIRMGERADDVRYEKSLRKRAEKLGIAVRSAVLDAACDAAAVRSAIDEANADPCVHGILLFRPLPARLKPDEAALTERISPEKDIDGMTSLSLAGVFTNRPLGFPPCTAEACIEILKHYHIDIPGRRAAVIGRSLVIGRPAAMLLMHENATVTVCHSKSADVPAITRNAELIITAVGKARTLTADYVSTGQTVIDVSMNYDEQSGKFVGDTDFAAVEPIVSAITPVPGGVGAVTVSVLMSHVVTSALRSRGENR